jgi:hypothetical protein
MSFSITNAIKEARKDPALQSTLNINELLAESATTDDGLTLTEITEAIADAISELDISENKVVELCNKVTGYVYIDEIHELQKGRHVRWIRRIDAVLTNGGIVVDIKFLDNGTHVLCMNSQRRFIQYKFDDCITFQKMTLEEQVCLLAKETTSTSPA